MNSIIESLFGGQLPKSGGRGVLADSLFNPWQKERDELQAREKKYYEDHPQNTLKLTPTGETTKFGMPVYLDQYNNHHSESSATFQLDSGKWVTAPMIWEGRYFTQKETKALIQSTGLKNPTTGEDIPVFGTQDEAIQYAITRDLELQR